MGLWPVVNRGRPPEGHPLQCTTIYKTGPRRGKRCSQWAMKDKRTGKTTGKCFMHGGRRRSGRRRLYKDLAQGDGNNALDAIRYTGIHMFYGKQLHRTLKSFVEESLQLDPSAQLDLREELALMREAAGQAVSLYSIAVQNLEAQTGDVEKQAAHATMMACASLMQDALTRVAGMCKDATSVSMAQSDKISAHSISHVVRQVVRIAHAVFGEDEEMITRLEEFDQRLRDEIKLPGFSGSGNDAATSITPDQVIDDVLDMDESVPVLGVPSLGEELGVPRTVLHPTTIESVP